MSPRQLIKEASFKLFFVLDRLGLHVLPKHYYTPLPDYHWLAENKPSWMGRAPLTGITWNLQQQLDWLAQICRPYYTEVAGLEFYRGVLASGVGPGFGEVESQVLHCFLRAVAPPRVLEIGSGASTACMIHALGMNREEGRTASRITCIEPFPRKAFRQAASVRHIEQLCQAVPAPVFAELGPGDLLFVDSSHAVKVGSDVLRIYLDIIPRLAPGVYIHIHDVYLPYLYPRDALTAYFGSQETSLLLGLLTNNARLSVLACLSALHYDRSQALAEILGDYRPQANVEGLSPSPAEGDHFPSSLWLRTN
jgi:predicted O-methyltransferase YrrM